MSVKIVRFPFVCFDIRKERQKKKKRTKEKTERKKERGER